MAKKSSSPTKNGNLFSDFGDFSSITGALGISGNSKAPKNSASPKIQNTNILPDAVPNTSVTGVSANNIKDANYSEFVSSNNELHTGDPFSAGYSSGYESEFAKHTGNRFDGGHNGNLAFTKSGSSVPLFITDVNIDFSLTGSTAQSVSGQVFYPKNFNQASLVITCQAPNPLYYGKVIEAVRDSQMPLSYISHLRITQPNNQTNIIKGTYEEIKCQGYVSQATRSYQALTYSPEFQLVFTVAIWESPKDWADSTVTYPMQHDWRQLITPTKDNPILFEKEPVIAKTAAEQRQMADQATTSAQAAEAQQQLDAGGTLNNSKNNKP